MGHLVFSNGIRKVMKKFLVFTFSFNTLIELLLGLLMIFSTGLFLKLVFVPEPIIFIRMIGFFALCLALLSGLTTYRIQRSTILQPSIFDITIFFFSLHTILTFVLGAAAKQGLMSWLGFLVHWPLALLFALALGWQIFTRRTS